MTCTRRGSDTRLTMADPEVPRKRPRVVRVRLFLVNLVERLFALLARQV